MFVTIPSCKGRRAESTGENPAKNRRPACPHAPTTALPTRTNALHALHASSSPEFLQLNRVDPQRHQPRQQFCTVIRHAISPVNKTRQLMPRQLMPGAPAPRHHLWARIDTWMPRHIDTSSYWVLFQCFADSILP